MPSLDALPRSIRDKLDTLRDTLVAALGDDLHALIVHGSAVRGGYVEGRSDVDVLIVLGRDDRSRLEAIGSALLVARTSARIESMLLRTDELTRAADVFPLLYDDVRGCHVVLHGRDPFAGLAIADTHRRLRIEQELRDARIRLRLIISEAPQLPRQLAGALARKLKQLRSPLHALLRLRGREVEATVEAVLDDAAALYRVDAAPLHAIDRDPNKAYDTLITLLDAAITDVDTLEV